MGEKRGIRGAGMVLFSAKKKAGQGLGTMGYKQGRSDRFSQIEGIVGYVGFPAPGVGHLGGR